ncbi:hypothetical protein RJ641_004849 [Dillenia turbinata]|uniref:Uncharacterized protein n=1 Tax=Dillenia turbinata TaxID=194707 RepID=A0AAN8V890_9MAGN
MSTATMTTVVVAHARPRVARSMPRNKTSKPRSDVVALAPFTLPLVGTTTLRTTRAQSRIQQINIPGHNPSQQRWSVTGPPPSQGIWKAWETREMGNGNEGMHVVHADLKTNKDGSPQGGDDKNNPSPGTPTPPGGTKHDTPGSSPGGGGSDK